MEDRLVKQKSALRGREVPVGADHTPFVFSGLIKFDLELKFCGFK